MLKEPLRERSIGLTLVFDSREEKDMYFSFLTAAGRKPAAYIKFLLSEEIKHERFRGVL